MDSSTQSPDALAVQLGSETPEHIAQMQLGHRSQLMNRANEVRDTSNPFEATLGTPAARQRLDLLHPDHPGVADLFRTRELEQGLQHTTNDILGNSKTAQRQIAGADFENGFGSALDLGRSAAGAGIGVATGRLPIADLAKTARQRGSSAWARAR